MIKNYFFCILLQGCLIMNACFAQDREIAITIDDLPFVGSANNDPAKLKREQDRFMKIMQTLIDHEAPATGFVIAGTIEKGQWQLLEQFRQAGFGLGNHTYSHPSLNHLTAEKYIEDVDRADKILTPLFSDPKYFRYPYLAESDGLKKQKVYDYLSTNQYTIAPVTIDSKDYLFNEQLYAIHWRERTQRLNQIKQRYLAYIWNQTLRAEKNASKMSVTPVKQILLVHSNLLNSHCLGDVLDLYKKNGYRFITLTEALKAPGPIINTPIDTPKEKFEMNFEDEVLNSIFKYKS